MPILGHAKLVLRKIAEELRSQTNGAGRPDPVEVEAHISIVRKRWRQRWSPKLKSEEIPINPYRVIGELMKAVNPATTIMTHDSGNPRDQLVPLYESTTPRGYIGWGHSTQLNSDFLSVPRWEENSLPQTN